jgi:ribosomal protein L2
VVESFRRGIPNGLVEGFVDSKKIRGKAMVGDDDDFAAANASLAIGLLRARTVKPGNVLPLRLIPTGTIIHSVALNPDGRGILVRSAGSFGQIIVHEDNGRYSHVRLQSGEVRRVLQDCVATIGKVSNPLWKGRILGKAGRARWLGRRPHVRGVAMNAYVPHSPRPCHNIHKSPESTTPTEVVVASQNRTNILDLFGVGKQKEGEHGNLVLRVPRVAI